MNKILDLFGVPRISPYTQKVLSLGERTFWFLINDNPEYAKVDDELRERGL